MKNIFELIWGNILFYLQCAYDFWSDVLDNIKHGRKPFKKRPRRFDTLVKSAKKKTGGKD